MGGREIELARELQQDRITVYAIHIGGSQVPGMIANITTLTGGEVFGPGDPESLKQVFRRIDQMQQTELEKSTAEVMDDYTPWSIAGLSLLSVGLLAMFGLRYTPW